MPEWIGTIILGSLLTIMTGFMAWQAIAIIKAGKSIAILEKLLETISDDLKSLAKHDSLIAVMNNEIINIKADVTLLHEKIRDLERNEKPSLHRRQ